MTQTAPWMGEFAASRWEAFNDIVEACTEDGSPLPETLCPACHLYYHAPLPACPSCPT